MHYAVEIEIDLPRDRVIELFDNPDNMSKWQQGLQSFEPLSGEPGQPGARSRLLYVMGNREIELIETITLRDLPARFDGTYETKGVYNEVKNRFIELGPDRTRWESENEFRLTTWMMKLMGLFIGGAFRQQSLKYMQDFKAFAERGVDVNAAPCD